MIITRTPYRVSMFGGGSDYFPWYSQHGGAVLTSTINRYCYLSVRYMPAFLGTRYRVFWSKMEAVDRLEDIQHPGVRACLGFMGIDEGFEINHAGDLPARSGLGSSSAFTVGMLHALHVLKGEYVNKSTLASEAVHVEQVVMRETVGIQDQIECAHGGLNRIDIRPSGDWAVAPIILSAERQKALESRLLLFYTGLQRHASEIAADQLASVGVNEMALHRIRGLVDEAITALTVGELDDFGLLLDEGWKLKRGLSAKITNDLIDETYDRAKAAGALGGKLLGAGGGGFMLIYAPPEHQGEVRAALSSLIEVPFAFEHGGTQVVIADR